MIIFSRKLSSVFLDYSTISIIKFSSSQMGYNQSRLNYQHRVYALLFKVGFKGVLVKSRSIKTAM